MERQERREWGNSFKGIGNKLYRVLQLSVQKHFRFLKFQTCEALSWPHGTAKEKKKESYVNFFFSSRVLSFLKKKTTKCK